MYFKCKFICDIITIFLQNTSNYKIKGQELSLTCQYHFIPEYLCISWHSAMLVQGIKDAMHLQTITYEKLSPTCCRITQLYNMSKECHFLVNVTASLNCISSYNTNVKKQVQEIQFIWHYFNLNKVFFSVSHSMVSLQSTHGQYVFLSKIITYTNFSLKEVDTEMGEGEDEGDGKKCNTWIQWSHFLTCY